MSNPIPPLPCPLPGAVVLAGGQSRRMGRDKAWLKFDGEPLIVRMVNTVRKLGIDEILISGREQTDYSGLGCRVLHDLRPGLGPVAGIERALHSTRTPLLLVIAVDLPLMTGSFLRKLVARCDEATGVVAEVNGGLEPLVAVYPKRCHALAAEALAAGRHSARDFAAACIRDCAVRLFRVAPTDTRCFTNWNAPAELGQFD